MKYNICSSVFLHPSINWFVCMPESTEGILQGSVLVTIFPAGTAIKQAAAGAVTTKESGYVHTRLSLKSVWSSWETTMWKSHISCMLLAASKHHTLCFHELRITCPSNWVSYSMKGRTKDCVNRTVGSPCQAYGVMTYLVRFWCQFIIATCHLRWIRRCLWGGLWTTFGYKL